MRVLVALDDSPISARAARTAVRLFGPPRDAEFFVINVTQLPVAWVGGVEYGFVSTMVIDPGWDDPAYEDNLEHALADRAAAAGLVDAEAIVRTGNPVEEICNAASPYGVDVIVVGSHDKSALARLVSPSVASGVVRGTHLPVVVVSGDPPA
jgi:nucleotide-binding universal stress UspA family protein